MQISRTRRLASFGLGEADVDARVSLSLSMEAALTQRHRFSVARTPRRTPTASPVTVVRDPDGATKECHRPTGSRGRPLLAELFWRTGMRTVGGTTFRLPGSRVDVARRVDGRGIGPLGVDRDSRTGQGVEESTLAVADLASRGSTPRIRLPAAPEELEVHGCLARLAEIAPHLAAVLSARTPPRSTGTCMIEPRHDGAIRARTSWSRVCAHRWCCRVGRPAVLSGQECGWASCRRSGGSTGRSGPGG